MGWHGTRDGRHRAGVCFDHAGKTISGRRLRSGALALASATALKRFVHSEMLPVVLRFLNEEFNVPVFSCCEPLAEVSGGGWLAVGKSASRERSLRRR